MTSCTGCKQKIESWEKRVFFHVSDRFAVFVGYGENKKDSEDRTLKRSSK